MIIFEGNNYIQKLIEPDQRNTHFLKEKGQRTNKLSLINQRDCVLKIEVDVTLKEMKTKTCAVDDLLECLERLVTMQKLVL